MTREHRHREADEPGRDRPAGTQATSGIGNARDLMQSLQQQAGNSAVAGLMGGRAAGVQRAAKLGAGDELMTPDGDVAPLRTGTGKAAPPATKTTPGGGAGAQAQSFEQSLLDPMRALYACVRDVPPDYELALQHMNRVGQALNTYYQQYADSDPGTAESFQSALGWLSRVRDVLLRRVGQGKEMSDGTIAENVVSVLNGLKDLQGRLH